MSFHSFETIMSGKALSTFVIPIGLLISKVARNIILMKRNVQGVCVAINARSIAHGSRSL